LGNRSENIAPVLENNLKNHGVEARLCILAPIMELCLGIITAKQPSRETVTAETVLPPDFIRIEKSASSLGLWELFLDKAI
jgi:hypothetical protein